MTPTRLLSVLSILCLAIAAAAPPASAATSYSKAAKVGKAHGPGCGKGGFTDVKGRCWTCPSGYRHANVLLPPTNNKVCKKSGARTDRKGTKVGKSVVGICKKGWLSTNNGNCYTCPKGYKHDITKFGDKSGVCYKVSRDSYSKAVRKTGNLLCNKGFFDPIDGGSCWACPSSHPSRTLKSVKSNQACQTAACGAEGSRPCLITERIPSCNRGLIEDFVHNKCVKVNAKAVVCKTTVAALKAGKTVAGFTKIFSSSKSRTSKERGRYKNKGARDKLLARIAADIDRNKQVIPELRRVMARMQAKKKQVESLFSTDNFCGMSRKQKEQQIVALGLKPNFARKKASIFDDGLLIGSAHAATGSHFFMAYTVGVSGGVGIGGQVALTFVTDFRGSGGSYVSVGPQIVTNATIGVSPIGLQFFPKVSLKDFAGWGWGIAVSGGPPSKAVGAGVDVSFDEKFKTFQGFGISGSVGLGAIPGDASVSASHSWKMD